MPWARSCRNTTFNIKRKVKSMTGYTKNIPEPHRSVANSFFSHGHEGQNWALGSKPATSKLVCFHHAKEVLVMQTLQRIPNLLCPVFFPVLLKILVSPGWDYRARSWKKCWRKAAERIITELSCQPFLQIVPPICTTGQHKIGDPVSVARHIVEAAFLLNGIIMYFEYSECARGHKLRWKIPYWYIPGGI